MPFPEPERIRAILLDIEGTTTPVAFVYEVLFPYAARNLDRFIRQHFHDAEIRPRLDELKEQRIAGEIADLPAWHEHAEEAQIDSLVAYAQWLVKRDSKVTALKTIQGRIWEEGYARGELRGRVYPDVPPALRRWRQQGKRVYIYSSGSELAQKLLFRSTDYGDLTTLLQGFFDTSIGPKSDSRSYVEIASRISSPPQQVLFVSDSSKELEEAQFAGMWSALAIRSIDSSPRSTSFMTIHSFDEIFPG
jgi:enolase-phosphatase E1